MQDVAYRRANAGMALAVGGSRNAQSVRGTTARRAPHHLPRERLLPQLGRRSSGEDLWQGKVDAE